MKAVIILGTFALSVLVLAACVSSGWTQPAAKISAVKWEYKTMKRPDDPKAFDDALNQAGQDGWEYCDMQPLIQSRGAGQASVEVKTLVFKRAKQ